MILLKEISIKDKREETQRMNEEIQNQQELLEEKKRIFEEDCEKFNLFIQEQHRLSTLAEQDTKKRMEKSWEVNKRIQMLVNLKHQKSSEIAWIDDHLEYAKENK